MNDSQLNLKPDTGHVLWQVTSSLQISLNKMEHCPLKVSESQMGTYKKSDIEPSTKQLLTQFIYLLKCDLKLQPLVIQPQLSRVGFLRLKTPVMSRKAMTLKKTYYPKWLYLIWNFNLLLLGLYQTYTIVVDVYYLKSLQLTFPSYHKSTLQGPLFPRKTWNIFSSCN